MRTCKPPCLARKFVQNFLDPHADSCSPHMNFEGPFGPAIGSWQAHNLGNVRSQVTLNLRRMQIESMGSTFGAPQLQIGV